MSPTKKEFFSLALSEKIIHFQVTLWNKYCDARNAANIDWKLEKLKGDQYEFNKKVTLYNEKNYKSWSPILTLLREDLINQGESVLPCSFVNSSHFLESLLRAHRWLMKQNPAINLALQKFINHVVIVDCDDLIACSSFKFMGIIVIAPKITWCLADYVENLVHEISHIDLFIRQLIDPLIEENVLLDSPLRTKKRPTIGVFHAAFVLSRVVSTLYELLNDKNEQHEKNLTYIRLLQNFNNLRSTIDALKNAPFLTNAAKMLLEEINDHSLQYRELVL